MTASLAIDPMVKALSPGELGGGAADAGAGAAVTASGDAAPKCAVDGSEDVPPDMSDGRLNGPAADEPSEVAMAARTVLHRSSKKATTADNLSGT